MQSNRRESSDRTDFVRDVGKKKKFPSKLNTFTFMISLFN